MSSTAASPSPMRSTSPGSWATMALEPRDWYATIWNHPFIPISTDHPEYDDCVHLASWLILFVSSLTILIALWKAERDYRRRNLHATLPKHFWTFILLACVALTITCRLRLEHKTIQWWLQTQRFTLREANEDVPTPLGGLNAVDEQFWPWMEGRAQRLVASANGGLKPTRRLAYYEDSEDEESVSLSRLEEKAWRRAKESVRTEKKRLPYFEPPYWPLKHKSTWEYMDMLFDDPARFFWTAQWFAGFVAWTLYLVVECKRYGVSAYVHMAFIAVGGMLSLATAQCLFFALLLVTPKRRSGNVYLPTWLQSVVVTAFSFLCLHVLARFLQEQWLERANGEEDLRDRREALRGLKTAFVYLCGPWSLYVGRDAKHYCHLYQVTTVKRQFTSAWILIALGGAWFYFQTAKTIWDETDTWQRPWLFLGQSTHPWLQARNALDHYDDPGAQFGGVLGSHLWINALAFDVLLSGISLALWSVVAILDAKGMVRCGLFPFWDQVIEKVKLWTYGGLPDARANGGLRGGSRGGLRGGSTRSGAQYLLPGDASEASSEEEEGHPQVKKRPQRKTSRPPSRGPAPVPASTRGRRTRSTSARAASRPPEEPERSRSRSSTGRRASSRTRSGTRQTGRVARSVSPPALLRDIAESPLSVRRSERLYRGMSSEDSSEPDEEETLVSAGPACRDRAGQAEQAGLALALFAVGGLGMASAAVFGAEELEE